MGTQLSRRNVDEEGEARIARGPTPIPETRFFLALHDPWIVAASLVIATRAACITFDFTAGRAQCGRRNRWSVAGRVAGHGCPGVGRRLLRHARRRPGRRRLGGGRRLPARRPGGPVARWPGGRGQAHGDGDARCVDVCWWARWSRRAWRPGCRWPRVRCRRGPALGVPVGRDGRHARRLSRCAHRGVPLLAKEAPEALVDGGVDQWAGSARRAWRRRRRAAGGVEIAPAMTGGRMLGRAVDNMSSRTPWWKAWADGPWPNTRWTGRAPGPWRAGRPKRCCVATPANPCLRPGARRCRR